MNKIIAIVILSGGLFFGFLWGQQMRLEDQHVEVGQVSFMIDFGEGAIKTYIEEPIVGNITMFEILEQITAENNLIFDSESYEGLGILVTQIGEKRNGEDGKYWQYWVNNRFAAVSADTYNLHGGDVILWKFLKTQLYE